MMHGRLFIWIVIFIALVDAKVKAQTKPTPTTAPVVKPDGKLEVFFPFNSAELPPSEIQRLDEKCRQLVEYITHSNEGPGQHYYAHLGGHADVRERDAVELIKRRRAAVYEALRRCTLPIDPCPDTSDKDPEVDGDAAWHKVIFVKTRLQSTGRRPALQEPVDERAMEWPIMTFQPDSDERRVLSPVKWTQEGSECGPINRALSNWQRGLFIVAYSSSAEIDAKALAARRAKVALRALTEECHVDARRLFHIAMPPVPDPKPADYRRRVRLDLLLLNNRVAMLGERCTRPLEKGLIRITEPTPTIRFEQNAATLSREAVAALGPVCNLLKANDYVLEIRGFATESESNADGLPLQRAAAVRKHLVSCGVDPERMRTKKRDPATPPPGTLQGQVDFVYIP